MQYEVTNIGVVVIVRVAQHILAVVLAKTGERLFLGQLIKLAEGKYLAGSFVAAGFINGGLATGAVMKAGGCVVVGLFNGVNDFGEVDAVRFGVEFPDEFVDGHGGIVSVFNSLC